MITDTIVTATSGQNSDLFPFVLAIYAPGGQRILDMTYANGVFWKKVETSKYDLVTNDLHNPKASLREDFRQMSLPDNSFDMVVFDPPYMRTNNKPGIMAGQYHNQTINLRTHKDILALYLDGIREARRLLKQGGYLVIKCQDEIESGKQKWTHVELLELPGFVAEDLLVLMTTKAPLRGRGHEIQRHCRKNHSYFLVQRKLVSKPEQTKNPHQSDAAD